MPEKLSEAIKFRVGKDPERSAYRIQNATETQRRQLNNVPHTSPDGHQHEHGALTAGDNIISHRLGRKPNGWLVLRATGAAPSLYEKIADTTDKTITLVSANTASVVIWFF